jgi:hypothetical protein
MAAKLHELLAVEQDLAGTFKNILEETKTTFNKKTAHFMSAHRVLKYYDEEKERAEKAPEEHQAMQTTVQKKLDYQQKHIVRYLDAVLQKEKTNQKAVADIVVDGITIASNVPATFLLGLESKLKQVRDVYSAIPTLQPQIEWTEDPDKGEGVFKMKHAEETYKTEKVIVPQILYEATKEHPAQVEKIQETKNVGKYTKNVWSGMITSAQKSVVLGKIDKLIRAVKKARQRANSVEIEKVDIGKALFDHINS